MNEPTTDTLARLVSQRRKCLLQLRDLGIRQGEMIAVGNIAGLMQMLVAKQQLITALQKIEQALEPFRAQDPDARIWPSPAAREACAVEAEECRHLLEEVMDAERTNEKFMTARRDEVAQQLQQVSTSAQIRHAYQQNQSTPTRSTPAPLASYSTQDPPHQHLDLTADR